MMHRGPIRSRVVVLGVGEAKCDDAQRAKRATCSDTKSHRD